MRTALICLLSSFLGAIFAINVLDEKSPNAIVQAQENQPRRGPGFGLQPILPVPDDPNEALNSRRPPAAYDGLNSPDEQINVMVYERVNRSVAHITTKSLRADGFFMQETPAEGTGSGTILDKAGHILTNYHVIEDAREVVVTLYDGVTRDAKFVGADPVNDIAVIKVDAKPEVLEPARLGDSSNLKVGLRVFAIGNPFGFERTLSTGIISSLNRSLQVRGNRTIKSIIQIDAAVNPGNSGGPLLDKQARLIGMNTAIASRTGQSAGVGFAIPVNLVKRVVPQLILHGKVIRPEIGIARVYETDKGLLIARLTPDGPAEKAGLLGPTVVRQRRGPFIVERVDRTAADLIVALDGKEVTNVDDFLTDIEGRKPGDVVELTIIRKSRRVNVRVVLGGDDSANSVDVRS